MNNNRRTTTMSRTLRLAVLAALYSGGTHGQVVFDGTTGVAGDAPFDVWPAVDTGNARSTLMRAHPLLDDGLLQLKRAGRALANASLEAQQWWRPNAFVRVGGALFSDLSHIGQQAAGGSWQGVDVGVGARVAVTGMPGVVRVNLAKGLGDGLTALSVVYQP